MNEVIRVGISDIQIAKAPAGLKTIGLGSCIGLVIYQPDCPWSGLAHIMLPDSSMAKHPDVPPGKFADTAVSELIRLLRMKGASHRALKAKFAGGAEMFRSINGLGPVSIGSRNITAVKQQLTDAQIPLIACDVGGDKGRTVQFNPVTQVLHVYSINHVERRL
ncbi:hypothetical protein [Tuberibacillus sp. Marseille-P3662]|uniref:hypothetical protein n=1 Tax=Tuberibacillus sp. Marseille-P3662 TaxID=1965358 RepID=UPI000A1CC438|nr:hypothetical protein [Tuberibacillus sp. Marseille-P3662]